MKTNNSTQVNGSSADGPSTYTVTISENAEGQLVMWPTKLTLQPGDNMVCQFGGKQLTLTVANSSDVTSSSNGNSSSNGTGSSNGSSSSNGIVVTCSSCPGSD